MKLANALALAIITISIAAQAQFIPPRPVPGAFAYSCSSRLYESQSVLKTKAYRRYLAHAEIQFKKAAGEDRTYFERPVSRFEWQRDLQGMAMPTAIRGQTVILSATFGYPVSMSLSLNDGHDVHSAGSFIEDQHGIIFGEVSRQSQKKLRDGTLVQSDMNLTVRCTRQDATPSEQP